MKCERCQKAPVGYDLFDYCAECSRNLCPECMAAGCCGHVPAKSGSGEEPCDSCDVPGILAFLDGKMSGNAGKPPEGFIIVERCDMCKKYTDDLEAAKAYGTDAVWQDGNGTSQAICRPSLVAAQ